MVRRCGALIAALALAGCATAGPDYAGPPALSPQAGYGQEAPGHAAPGIGPEQAWWTLFGSAELDRLVGQALNNNPTVGVARATLERAQARLAAATGQRLPQADAHARVDHQQVNLSGFGLSDSLGAAGIGNPEFDLFSLGAGVRYDLDLFGGQRRAIEQAGADAHAQARALEAAHLLLAGRVVQQVFAIAALNDRLAVEQALIAEDERNLHLTRARERGGVGTMVDVLSAQAELNADQAALPIVHQQLAEGRAVLAALLGITPAELGPTPQRLANFSLPSPVPVTLPSDLIHKRPDILEAEARLHGATAAIGVAAARLYPSITLGATIDQASTHPDKLLGSSFRGFDLFAGLTAPLFHGGTLKAARRAAEADARAAAERYRDVVLSAFAQVSGLLAALETDAQALAVRTQGVTLSERSLHLSRRSFEVGNSGMLQVLDASRAHQRARLALLDAQARRHVNVARLLAATAGGWTGNPPTP